MELTIVEKMARYHIKPQDMFLKYTELYSAFDADGIPTHDVSGCEISKSCAKKLKRTGRSKRNFTSRYYTLENYLQQ